METVQAIYEVLQLNECQMETHIQNQKSLFDFTLQLVADINGRQDNVALLNVGGYSHHLSRQTVNQHRDSFFGGLFSESFEQPGHAFVDRDGKLFHAVVHYLRHGKLLFKESKRNLIADECEYYCLPPLPVTEQHLVCFETVNGVDQLRFLTVDGKDRGGVSVPHTGSKVLPYQAASSPHAAYIVENMLIFEYEYESATWTVHKTQGPSAPSIRQLYATNAALYALDWTSKLHQLKFDGTWQWNSMSTRCVGAIATTQNTLFAAVDDTVYSLNEQTCQWGAVCDVHLERISWMAVVQNRLCVCSFTSLIIFDMRNLTRSTISTHNPYNVARGRVVGLNGALYFTAEDNLHMLPILSDGTPSNLVRLSNIIDRCGYVLLGVRDGQLIEC